MGLSAAFYNGIREIDGARKIETNNDMSHENVSLSLLRFRQIMTELMRTMVANTLAPEVVLCIRVSSSGVIVKKVCLCLIVLKHYFFRFT